MKQVLQHLKTGVTEVADVPCPRPGRGQLLIRSKHSLVSAGTERMLVDFGKAGLIEKARQQPDKVRMVLDKVRTDGIGPTLAAVRNKLDQPLPMGYCNVGMVAEVGAGVSDFQVGDRVVSNGRHAEMVCVPVNLCARVPANVSDEDAAFTVLASIALQGIRLVQPTLGETVVVTGLGLIGLLTVQLLHAHGCRVLGIDFDSRKLKLARAMGAEVVDAGAGVDPVSAAQSFSRGRGVDAVIITASTRSDEPVHQAALMCRKRGRIVLVGVAGLQLSRADFYEKELTFQVSCSYGPGRYDPSYEERGQDYPFGYVRWTEQRNFEAVLDMLAQGRLQVRDLVSHRYRIDESPDAYDVVGGSEPALAILLNYPEDADTAVDRKTQQTTALRSAKVAPTTTTPTLSFIGSGNYAGAVLIPAFRATGVRLLTLASSGGVSSLHLGRKHGFEQATTDTDALLADPRASAVVVSTRHDSHAEFVIRALQAAKHVFVEKPLCVTLDALAQVETECAHAAPLLMVGFNRRFAPHIQRIKKLLASTPGPKSFVMTVNAGSIPGEHWTQDETSGGGRVIGEACHFIDLLRFLASAPVGAHDAYSMSAKQRDTVTINLRFEDGSIGAIHYFANGSKTFPKERLEVFAGGRVLQLDNFRRLTGYGWPAFRSMNLWRQDKGQHACAKAFVDAVASGGDPPITRAELFEVARVTIEIAQGLQ